MFSDGWASVWMAGRRRCCFWPTKAALISAVPPLMLKTVANPDGLPMEKLDLIRKGAIVDRSQLYQEIASGSSSAPNGRVPRSPQGTIDPFWLQGMQAGHRNNFGYIKMFSETDFTEYHKQFEAPTPIIHDKRGKVQNVVRNKPDPLEQP